MLALCQILVAFLIPLLQCNKIKLVVPQHTSYAWQVVVFKGIYEEIMSAKN